MYEIIFAYRADMDVFLSVDDVIEATNHIIAGVKVDNVRYLDSIGETIRPMSTLFSGLHCNIEELCIVEKHWPDFFMNNKTEQGSSEIDIKWSKRLGNNFVRICILTKGKILFR